MEPFEQAALKTVREELTRYLDPIAKVLVKQTAARARNLSELYQQLAEQIPAITERSAFLKRVPGQEPRSSV